MLFSTYFKKISFPGFEDTIAESDATLHILYILKQIFLSYFLFLLITLFLPLGAESVNADFRKEFKQLFKI